MSSCSVPGQVRRVFKDAGRVCPVDYRLASDAFAGDPEVACDVLYVVGGLYGNPFALDAVDRLVAAEQGDVRVVLNGDLRRVARRSWATWRPSCAARWTWAWGADAPTRTARATTR